MNRTLLAIVASLGWTCAAGAEGEPRNPLAKATQEEANSFYGMSEQELIAAIGYPFEIKLTPVPSGAILKYYMYVSEWKHDTWFVIPSDNGTIISGLFLGTRVIDPNWKPPTSSVGGQAVGGGRNVR